MCNCMTVCARYTGIWIIYTWDTDIIKLCRGQNIMNLIQLLSVNQSKQCLIDFKQLLGLSGYFSKSAILNKYSPADLRGILS